MEIKTAFIDLDGTLTTEDMLDVVCRIVGKGEESARINELFHKREMSAVDSLAARIKFLRGVYVTDISAELDNEAYLMPGAKELVGYLKASDITTVIASGNLVPVLQYYQRRLGADYVLGTKLEIDNGVMGGLSGIPRLKYEAAREFLEQRSIDSRTVIAVGDSMADRAIFGLAARSIAIDPKDDIARYANTVIYNDLHDAIPIIEGWRKESQ